MNKYYRNPHGSNFGHTSAKEPGGSSPKAVGSGTANWPGTGGKTQGKARNAGVSKTGHKGPFYVKQEGL